MLATVQATELYYTNRNFTAINFNIQGNPPLIAQLNTESKKLTNIVQGAAVQLNTNADATYAIEKQMAIPFCYGSPEGAWEAAVAYNGTPSNHPGTFDNVGWVRGTTSDDGEWGAYLWIMQNKITFLSSTSDCWKATNGISVTITNVMVGSLGNYGPTSTVVDTGPHLDGVTNYPGSNQWESKDFRVDITNVYYQLSIPDIWISPRSAYAMVDGSNVQFTVTGTNISNGVTWAISPTNFAGHAEYQSSTNFSASVTPGSVATNYKVRARSKDNTNFYDEVNFAVCKIEVTNIKFNHNTGSSAGDGINIRQDYNTPYNISNGEWIEGVTNIPVCYTTNKTVTIKARLITTPDVNVTADIWAESTDSGGSLGGAVKTNVTFISGVTNDVIFQVSGTTPNCVKKTTTDVWEWKIENINNSGSAACALNTSGVHTVYTILAEPVSPWVNTAGNQKNAWTKVLDFDIESASCDGDSTISNAMGHITAYLQGNGFGMTYDTTNGASHYGMWGTGGDFDLTAYMNGSGCVNCYDQAAGVLVCTRLLGGAPSYLFMSPFGYIHQANVVGVGQCNNPFFNDYTYTNRIHTALVDGGTSDRIAPERSGFGNHAIIRNDGLIYDATCGPHSGTESLLQYATSSIDITSTNERPASPDGYGWGGDENGVFSTAEVDSAISNGNVGNIH